MSEKQNENEVKKETSTKILEIPEERTNKLTSEIDSYLKLKEGETIIELLEKIVSICKTKEEIAIITASTVSMMLSKGMIQFPQ